MPIVASHFKPAWWLKNPHLQTIWPTLFRLRPTLSLQQQRVELDDGDFIDLSWSGPLDAPVVLILHGLEGSIDSPYAFGLINTLTSAGYRSCFMHFRSCSKEPNRLPRGYHSGETNDLQFIVNNIKASINSHLHAIIGYSLGGNVLLKWLGEQDRSNDLHSAIAISVPFKLAHAGQRMETGISRLYQKHLVSSLIKKFRQKQKQHPTLAQIELDKIKTFYEFDDSVTAKVHGFESADDYYQKCSCDGYLKFIQQPTLIIHAKDDPFMWQDTSPPESRISATTTLELSSKGGHAGFISGTIPWRPVYWHEQRILSWLKEVRPQ